MEGTRQGILELIGCSVNRIPGIVRELLLLSGVLLFASPVWSLGLGKLEVNSHLDEPLDIRIELLSGTVEELETAGVRLATREEFALIGLQRPEHLDDVQFRIVADGEEEAANTFSGPYIRLTSDKQMKEPFLHFLVRLNWSGGRLLREYTALIDPPVYAAEAPVQISSPRVVNEPDVDPGDATDSVIAAPAVDPVAQSAPAESIPIAEASPDEGVSDSSSDAAISDVDDTDPVGGGSAEADPEGDSVVYLADDGSFASYGPTEEGDTLSGIASQFSAEFPDIDMYQVMYVLVRENPEAFIDGNMNLMMKGQILQLSTLDTVREIATEDARSDFREHLYLWEGYAQFAAGAAVDPVLVPRGQEIEAAGDSEFLQDDELSAPGEFTDVSGGIGSEDGFMQDADLTTENVPADESFESGEQFRIGSADNVVAAVGGQGSEGGSSDGEVLAMQGQVSELESALFSTNLENEDLRQRISLLEDQLTDVNRLISLGDQDLAVLQESVAEDSSLLLLEETAEIVEDNIASTDMASTEGSDSVPSDEGVAPVATVADSGDQEGVLPPGSEALAIAGTVPAVATPAATMNTRSWWSRLLESLRGVSSLVMTLVGLFVVALAGLFYLRRRRALEEFEHSMLSIGIDSVSAPTQGSADAISGDVGSVVVAEEDSSARESSFLTVYSDSEVVVHADEVDPIAEADVYLAYGRDQQAEEVLIDGMSKFPDRDDIKLKLLTIYRKRKDVSAFETLAEELYPTGSDASQDTWELVARMGRKISPDNPLFSESAMPADEAGPLFNETSGTITGAPAEQDEASIVPVVEEEADSGAIEYGAVDDGDPDIKANVDIDLSSEEVQEEITLGGDALDSLEFDLKEDSAVAEGAGEDIELDSVADQVTAVMNSLDFDDDSEEDASSSGDEPDADKNIEAEEESIDPGSGDTRVALETGVPVGNGSERSEVIEFTPELTARREQRNGRGQGGSGAGASPSAPNETKSEFETQIELAKVFIELGDKDGARKILSEVLTDGESDHRRMAEELMSAMNE